MDQTAALESWKSSLSKLANTEQPIKQDCLKDLSKILEHLTPKTAPRLQRDYNSCCFRTHKYLGELFERLDLADKPLLCTFLRLLKSYGYFRIARLTYSTHDPSINSEQDELIFPQINKTKWYDMSQFLPDAGTIGWKMILNHGMVKEEKKLFQICLQLCALKLHFCSVVIALDRYQDSVDVIKKNGYRVAEKLLEIIKDSGHDDYCMIDLDSRLFSLLLPFINDAQQASIIETVVSDIFKPYFNPEADKDTELARLYKLIDTKLINKQELQQVLIDKLLEHLKLNIIRRKRRHSVESADEGGLETLEGLIDSIRGGEKLLDLVAKIDHLKVSRKSLQTNYLSFWIGVITRILPQRILLASSSVKLLSTCSVILLATSNIISQELVNELAFLLARTIDATGQGKLDKLFKNCSPIFLIDLTKNFCEKTQIITTFTTPMQTLYGSYLSRYLRFGLSRGNRFDTTELIQYIDFICDKSIERGTSHLLQYIFVKQLARCIEIFKNRDSSTLHEAYATCARKCAKRLFKFIKRNITTILEVQQEDNSMHGDDFDSSSEQLESEMKKTLIVDALLSTIQIALDRKDQEILDTYSDLLLRVFSTVNTETTTVCDVVKRARLELTSPIAIHLCKLIQLYVEHKDLIKAYLNYDLIETIPFLIFTKDETGDTLVESESVIKMRKVRYSQIKKKLKTLEEQAKKSKQVYMTIINKQYSSVIEQSLAAEMKREKPCCRSYIFQIQTLSSLVMLSLNNCSTETYRSCLEWLTSSLNNCDPFDHPKLLYLLVLCESAIPNFDHTSNQLKTNIFRDNLFRLCGALLRLSKTVELGPSIHTFSKPGTHKSSKAIQCCTYTNCLKVYTSIITKCPPKIITSFIPSALNLCISANLFQYAKHSLKLQDFFVQLAFSISGLLKIISQVMKEEEIFNSALPVYLSAFSNLIGCVILASDRRKIDSLSESKAPLTNGFVKSTHEEIEDRNEKDLDEITTVRDYENQLEFIAIDISKSLNNLSSFKVKLVDYAPHLISSYVKSIQQASCPDFVRLHLNEGIFRIFNLIDAHQKKRQEDVIELREQRKIAAGRASGSLLEMIHSRLDQASREVFKDLHENYTRFHRYQGKC